MEPWFQIILSGGNFEQKLQQIATFVTNQRLAPELTAIYVEKKPRGQFYIFLAVASEGPTNKSSNLNTLIGLLGHEYGAIYEYDEIKRMVGGKIETKNFARRLSYRYRFEISSSDPFDLASGKRSSVSPAENDQTENFNKLLYWLSATGKGTWTSFQATCKALNLAEPGRILRRLRLLGHIEVGDNGQHWQICPPCLVQSGPLIYYLAGQRNGVLLAQLKQMAGVTLSKAAQPNGTGPEIIRLTFLSNKLVPQTCQTLGLRDAGMASYHHATALSDLVGLKILYPTVSIGDPVIYRWERWGAGQFEVVNFQNETGFYRLTHRLATENDRSAATFYYDSEDKSLRRGDWYGLRYLAQAASGEATQVIYNPSDSCLAVPKEQRWPDLYERALVLSSGSLPQQHKDWLYYPTVSLEVAQLLTTKLNATLNYKEA